MRTKLILLKKAIGAALVVGALNFVNKLSGGESNYYIKLTIYSLVFFALLGINQLIFYIIDKKVKESD